MIEAFYKNNSCEVRIGAITVWFSYRTLIAFQRDGQPPIVRVNDWSTTTGRHLNAIDGGDKSNRIDGQTFEQRLTDALEETPNRKRGVA